MYNNSLAIGTLWHKRYLPKIHQFGYKINMWLIDLDNADVVNKNLNIFYKYRDRDYITDQKQHKLKDRVFSKVNTYDINIDINSKIFLLGQVSNLGTYFSPLNLFLIYAPDDNLKYILAEVSNTPWNEKHCYLLDPMASNICHDKNFHVSPFFSMEQKYIWNFTIEDNTISFSIDLIEKEQNVFSAMFNSRLISLENAANNNIFFKAPFNGVKILAGIYFEAFRLFMKKLKLYKHPKTYN